MTGIKNCQIHEVKNETIAADVANGDIYASASLNCFTLEISSYLVAIPSCSQLALKLITGLAQSFGKTSLFASNLSLLNESILYIAKAISLWVYKSKKLCASGTSLVT